MYQTSREQILQLGFIKKHIHNFLADIVSRESHKIGEGTMVLKAAAVNMLADAEVWGEGIAVSSTMRFVKIWPPAEYNSEYSSR